MRVTYNSKRYHRPDIVGPELAPSMTYTNWSVGNSATLSNDADGNLKILYNAVSYPYAYKQITGLTANTIYRVRISSASDGTASDSTVSVGATGTTGDLAYSDTRGTTSAQDYEFYVRSTTTSIYIVLSHLNASSGYSLFSSVSVRQVTTLSHDLVNVLYDGAQWGMYTAVNSTIDPTVDVWGINGIASGEDGDNAIKVINTGAAYGRANRTYAFPTVSGRQYKASALWIPHSATYCWIFTGSTYGDSNTGTENLYADIDHATAPFFTAASGLRWNFTNTLDSWTLTNATNVNNATYVSITATTADPIMERVGLSFSGYQNRYVAARIKRTSASWANECVITYATASHALGASYGLYYCSASVATLVQNDYTVLVWDMWQLTAGGTDWKDNTITGLRFDATSTNGATYDVDWIAVGNLNPLEVTFTATGQDYSYIGFQNSNETDAVSYYVLPHVDQLDSEYTLEQSAATVLARTPADPIGDVNEADDGTTWGVIRRIDRGWNVTTDIFAESQRRDWEEFFNSCLAGETFEFDAYGTTASQDDPIQARLVPKSWNTERVQNSGYWTASFSLKEVEQ